jgi:hypothetical protein
MPSRRSNAALTGLSPAALIVLYVVIGLAPLVLAQLQGLPARNFWRELSSGLVMVGFAMLLVEFVLSGRFRPVSGKVGIDLTMRFHQLAALTILVFILVHPLLYAVPRLSPNPADALTSLQRMFVSQGLRSGVIAWWLLILFVAAAIWRDRLPFRYEIWRASHGIGAALIAALSAHHTLRVGTYSGDPLLAGFWIVLTGVALASLVYVYAVKPLMQRGAPYRVVANDKAADRMWRIASSRNGETPSIFRGTIRLGEFRSFAFQSDRAPLLHFFGAVGPAAHRIHHERGGRFHQSHRRSAGRNHRLSRRPAWRVHRRARKSAPARLHCRRRRLRADHGHAAPIARRGLAAPHRADLWQPRRHRRFCIATKSRPLPGNRPESASRPFRAAEGWRGPIGELTPDLLKQCLEPVDREADYFVCGPTPMMDSVERSLLSFGIASARIVSERFKYD